MTAGTRSAIYKNYTELPLAFEVNRGQADSQVKYLARGRGYGVFLTGAEAVLALQSSKPDVIQMQLRGANAAARADGVDLLPGTANYFVGHDRAKWHAGVQTYSKVRFSRIYPGVDVLYYGNQRQLEFDFVVAAQADPKVIGLQFANAGKIALNASGDLLVSAQQGQIAFHSPVIYQDKNGHHQAVAGGYDSAGFNAFVTGLNANGTALIYSTYLGRSISQGNGIALSSKGGLFVAGSTRGAFPTTPDAFKKTFTGSGFGDSNGFIAKFDLLSSVAVEFSPRPGKYVAPVEVTLSAATAGGPIYYTLDGSEPTLNSTLYTEPIPLTSFTGYSLKAIAVPNGTPSSVAEGFYTLLRQTPAPWFTPVAGTLPSNSLITIKDANPGATIRFTTNGSTPGLDSTFYGGGPIVLTRSETIKAIAISTGEATSNVTSASFTVQ